MLTSFAIENLLKAVIIINKRNEFEEYLEKNCSIPESLKKHDLDILVKTAKMDFLFNQDQLSALKKLTYFAIWKGRYPISISSKWLPFPNSNKILINGKKLNGFSTEVLLSNDVQIIDSIIGIIEKEIKKMTN